MTVQILADCTLRDPIWAPAKLGSYLSLTLSSLALVLLKARKESLSGLFFERR